jgi:hypothetical protein
MKTKDTKITDKIVYSTPESVIKIMEVFGSSGFNNTSIGLLYCKNGKCKVFKKGEEVTKEKLEL